MGGGGGGGQSLTNIMGTLTRTIAVFFILTLSGCLGSSVVYDLQTTGPPDDYTSIILYPACLGPQSKPRPSPSTPSDLIPNMVSTSRTSPSNLLDLNPSEPSTTHPSSPTPSENSMIRPSPSMPTDLSPSETSTLSLSPPTQSDVKPSEPHVSQSTQTDLNPTKPSKSHSPLADSTSSNDQPPDLNSLRHFDSILAELLATNLRHPRKSSKAILTNNPPRRNSSWPNINSGLIPMAVKDDEAHGMTSIDISSPQDLSAIANIDSNKEEELKNKYGDMGMIAGTESDCCDDEKCNVENWTDEVCNNERVEPDNKVECESKGDIAQYTICVAFFISSFTSKATVFSYAINYTHTNTLALAVTPQKALVTYNYKAHIVDVENLYMLKVWRRVCIVGDLGKNHTFYLDGVALYSWPWEHTLLHTGGSLVVGQDQDHLLGGFSSAQAFRGKVTDLNVWSQALTSEEIQQLELCQESPPSGNWVSWDDASWEPRGRYSRLGDGPCQFHRNSILFFDKRLPYQRVLRTLQIKGLYPYLPQNQMDVDELYKKIRIYGTQCDNAAIEGQSVWVNAVFNFTSQHWENAGTNLPLNFSLPRHQRTYESALAVVQINNNKWMTDDIMNENCFAGLLPKEEPLFHLRGLIMNGQPKYQYIPFSFVIAQTPEKNVHFLGLQHMVIEHINKQWELIDCNHNQTIATLAANNLPVGRKLWQITNSDNIEVNLTLSICSSEEFTCDDGSCVAMDKRCDLVCNCRDLSDERNCDVALAPIGYIRSLPPSPYLTITLYVDLDIIEVKLRAMTLVLEVTLVLFWYDPGVSYRNLRPISRSNVVATSEGDCPLWQPSVEVDPTYSFSSQRSSSVMVRREGTGKNTRDDVVFKGADNPLKKVVTLQPEIRCRFDLHLFPWDKQKCSFNITVANINHNGMKFNESTAAQYMGRMMLDEYILEEVLLSRTGDGNIASVEVTLTRLHTQYLWHTFLPTTFLLGIGYGTLFLPVEPFNDRGTMSLTTLLVLVALYTDALSRLPSISYNTHADVWYIFTMIYLTLVIATHIYTSSPPTSSIFSSTWVGPPQKQQTGKFLRRARIVFALIFIIFVIGYTWPIM